VHLAFIFDAWQWFLQALVSLFLQGHLTSSQLFVFLDVFVFVVEAKSGM